MFNNGGNNGVSREALRSCLQELGVENNLAESFINVLYKLRKKLLYNGTHRSDPNLSRFEYLWHQLFSETIQAQCKEEALPERAEVDLSEMIQTQIDVMKKHLL